jgi:hypothetical protein
MTSFDDGLWNHLVQQHGASQMTLTAPDSRNPTHAARVRSWVRPARVKILAGSSAVIAALAAAAVFALAGATSPPAYAVTAHADGSVTVTINQIAAISAANTQLTSLGIHAVIVPMTASCQSAADVVRIGVANPATATETIVPGMIPQGDTAILGAAQTNAGTVELALGEVSGAVPACLASGGSGPGLNNG